MVAGRTAFVSVTIKLVLSSRAKKIVRFAQVNSAQDDRITMTGLR
jgi:hypothetical protein